MGRGSPAVPRSESALINKRCIERSCLLLPLHITHRRLRPHAAAAAREGLEAIDLPLAPDGAAREGLPIVGPIAERIAVPGRLRRDRRELELLPDRACALH